jgi:hypothetical protein
VAGQGTDCSAETELTFGQLRKRKCKYRLKHSPTGTCYLKVWLRKTTTITADPDADPPVEASTTHDDSTYEWNGTGNPCFSEHLKAYDAAENIIYSEVTEIPVPETKSEVVVSLLKYSCLEGYEPDISDPENKQPNGFPDPAWEAAAP